MEMDLSPLKPHKSQKDVIEHGLRTSVITQFEKR